MSGPRQVGTERADVAFVDVRVVPMDRERVLESRTVLVDGETIRAIGPVDATTVPARATRIEGRGAYLMPGLADMHVHLWSERDLPLYLANGVTTLRNMNGRPFHLSYRRRVRAGEVLGPDLITAGPIVNHKPAPVPIKTAEQARRLVDEQAEAGYDFIKVYSFVKEEVYDAIIERAGERGLQVAGHVPSRMPIERVLAKGQASIEHLLGYSFAIEAPESPLRDALRRGRWSYRYQYCGLDVDEARIEELAAATSAAGVWNCPTLVMMDRWLPREVACRAILEQPQMSFVDPEKRAGWSAARFLADTTPARRRQGRRVRRRLVRALRDAGAGLLLGTDVGANFVEPGFSIHAELRALVSSGLTPFEALAAGTRDAARFLGAEDRVGTVAPGRRADLVLLAENPLAGVAAARRPLGVMVRGRWLPAAVLESALERLEASYERAGAA